VLNYLSYIDDGDILCTTVEVIASAVS